MVKSMIIAVFAALLLLVAPAARAATNDWAAPIAVTQTAAAIKINNIQIAVMADGKVVVIVAWTWVDDAGKVLRNGTTRYTEAQIAAKLQAKGSSIDSFRQLFLAIAREEAVAP